VIAVTNGVAVRFARYGVRANSILPGWIGTDLTAAAQGGRCSGDVISRVPAALGQTERVRGVAVYLASVELPFRRLDCHRWRYGKF
jgi:NAD(P)-dependent dehydrogenase (short-subunit alcohol dehydrogenase family)